MKRVAEKGDAYLASETQRLTRLSQSDSLQPAKKLQLLKNLNILDVFDGE